MRFPTDMKLLWESIEWLYRHICKHCGELGIRRPRNKYDDVAKAYLSYCKKRKRKASRTRMLKRRMIRLLEKLLMQRDGIHREHVNPEKPDVPLNKNDAFQKVQKRRVQENGERGPIQHDQSPPFFFHLNPL